MGNRGDKEKCCSAGYIYRSLLQCKYIRDSCWKAFIARDTSMLMSYRVRAVHFHMPMRRCTLKRSNGPTGARNQRASPTSFPAVETASVEFSTKLPITPFLSTLGSHAEKL
jgi:hypothetical protein